MIDFFRNLEIERTSFWIGFLAGVIFLVLGNLVRKVMPGIIKSSRQQIIETREKLTASVETRLRNDVVRHTQKLHLASTFFALDEIALEPRVIAPPPLLTFHKTPPAVDVVQLTLPYTPDWPELAATYRAPTLTLIEALQEQANLLILGHAGSGKTFSLAWLATRVARKDPLCGNLGDLIPVFFHASDIPTDEIAEAEMSSEKINDEQSPEVVKEVGVKSVKTRTSFEILMSVISRYASALTLPRLPALLTTSLAEKRCILIIDGFDELPYNRFKKIVKYLTNLLTEYPGNRIIVAGSFEYTDGLRDLGLFPVALAAWGDEYREKFVLRWSTQWNRLVLPYYPLSPSPTVYTQFLNNWLRTKETPSTPFEVTLKVWGAYSGDILGIDQPNLVESYLRRATMGIAGALTALEQLAFLMVSNQNLYISQQEANQWISPQSKTATPEPDVDIVQAQDNVTFDLLQIHGHVSLTALVNGGILTQLPGGHVTFSHPIFIGYLAGNRLAKSSDLSSVQEQEQWIGKALALYFMAYFGDVSFLAMSLIRNDDFLYSDLLKVARWLRITPRSKAWRSLVLRTLANALNSKEADTLALSAKLLTALALSGDQGVAVLFRQLLKSDKPSLRQLAALGCGLLREAKAVEDLAGLIENPNPSLARSACLALVEIGDKNALEIVASALMHGSEVSRRAAAEALANHPTEGHPALEEGSTLDDLMVRRSVVFGLGRVRQPWAIEILEKLQMEDKEWIVRNAAIQALEEIRQPNPHIPRALPSLTDTAWLVEFASKQGLGVTSGEQAESLVLQALKSGTEDERLQAMEFLALKGKSDIAASVYAPFFGSAGDQREAAYQALWLMSLSGVELPPPKQFGYA